MPALDALVEQRIREAQARGEFDDLPGAGAPLDLRDDSLVPEDLRAAYRILKNAGFLPPELEAHAEIRKIEELLRDVGDEDRHAGLLARMRFLLGRSAGRHHDLRVSENYLDSIAERLARTRIARNA